MARWLSSGLRRDLCVVICALVEPTEQECKAELEAHYGEHVPPERVYGALDRLVEAGHVERREAGIHDRHELTPAGRRALVEHCEWLSTAVEG